MEDQNKNKNFSPSASTNAGGQNDDYLLDEELEKDLEIGSLTPEPMETNKEETKEKRPVKPVTEEDIERRIDSLAEKAFSASSEPEAAETEKEEEPKPLTEEKKVLIKEETAAANNQEEKKEAPQEKEEEWKKYFRAQILKMQNELQQMLEFLDKENEIDSLAKGKTLAESLKLKNERQEQGKKIIEGVFTGEEMVGPDGKRYSVPSNYASKSKLVEGDILKLIIEPDGTFIYKQIGPVKRERIVGTLIKNENSNQYYILADGKRWRLLRAAVTYFSGRPGDEVIALVPEGAASKYAAVENIVKAKS